MVLFKSGIIESEQVGEATAAMISSFAGQKHGGGGSGGHLLILHVLESSLRRPSEHAP